MIILGIETSCDDTGISLIKGSKNNIEILANCVASQEQIHSPYGGVFPSLAKREHQKNILPLFKKALKKAHYLKSKKQILDAKKLKQLEIILERYPELLSDLKTFLTNYQKPEIDQIAVTIGPGLEPCLWVGINFSKAIGYYWDIDIVPVNHLEGHLIAGLLEQKPEIVFPSIGLIVSGGNTQIFFIEKFGRYKLVGETRDDAAGECFDKTARLLGLGYPGGKKISELAKKSTKKQFGIKLPRPMIHEKNLDFSFSGLKTAVLYETKKRDQKTLNSEDYKIEMAKEIETAIVDVLTKKVGRAIDKYQGKGLIAGGGVSANTSLRKSLKKIAKEKNIKLLFPKIKYTGDNAAMIASILFFSDKRTAGWNKLKPNSNLKING